MSLFIIFLAINRACPVLLVHSRPHVLSLTGGIYCCSASEVEESSVSARQAAAGFSVPLKEGMRPAQVVAEEAEIVEAGKDENQAEKETAAADEEKPSQEQPVYVFCVACVTVIYEVLTLLVCCTLIF